MNELDFKSGLKDGLPIMLGYFTVAFTFGVAAVADGFLWWMPVLCSITNFTGTGQFVGMDLLAAGAGMAELVAAMLVVNIRYSLMSVTLGQRLKPDTKLWQRFVAAFGNTDENFAVAIRRNREIPFRYFLGVAAVSYAGWVGGTLAGALAGNVLPEVVLSAFGIAIHAMFIAILLPPVKASKPVAFVVALSVGLSCLFYYTPGLKSLSNGWAVIVCALVSAGLGAWLFPFRQNKQDAPGNAAGPSADKEES